MQIVKGKGYSVDLFSPIRTIERVKHVSAVNINLAGWLVEPTALPLCAAGVGRTLPTFVSSTSPAACLTSTLPVHPKGAIK